MNEALTSKRLRLSRNEVKRQKSWSRGGRKYIRTEGKQKSGWAWRVTGTPMVRQGAAERL